MMQYVLNKVMIYYLKIDWILLNLASFGVMSLLSDYVDQAVKLIGILSVAILNIAKAYSYFKQTNKPKEDEKSN